MKKISIFTALFLLSASPMAYATSSLSGDWCQNTYNDFNMVMTISENGDIKRTMVGVEAGETGRLQEGFISVGASNITMELSGQPVSVYNVEVKKHWFTQKETLHIDYNDTNNEIYDRCVLNWTDIKK